MKSRKTVWVECELYELSMRSCSRLNSWTWKGIRICIAMRPTKTISCYWQMCCVVMCLGRGVHVHISFFHLFSEFAIFCRQAIWQSLSGVWDGRRATRPVKQYEAVWSGECPVWARYAAVSRHSNLAIELPNHTQEHWKAGSNWSPVQSCLVAQQ